MKPTSVLATDADVVERILDHIDCGSTDESAGPWREPVDNYRSEARLSRELDLFRRYPTPFCPSAALPEVGSYLAREAAGTPLVAARGEDGQVHVFRNACRHRGAQVASGTGCHQAFRCPYHAWTYGLDGTLRAVPHERGFPGLDRSERGLVPVASVELQGLVFVTQDAPLEALFDDLPVLIPAGFRLLECGEQTLAANWKIIAEGFLEGYHIRATHETTFYPVQYDNLNVVEAFGRNSRVAFPYRAIERLREAPPGSRSVEGKLTYVYHLFPNVMVATFPRRRVVVVLEPLDASTTLQYSYTLSDADPADDEAATVVRDGLDFVGAGAAEDRDRVTSVQRGLASGANAFFEFGLFEGGLAHFHRNLQALVAPDAARL